MVKILIGNRSEQVSERKRLFGVRLDNESAFRDRQIHGEILAETDLDSEGLGNPQGKAIAPLLNAGPHRSPPRVYNEDT